MVKAESKSASTAPAMAGLARSSDMREDGGMPGLDPDAGSAFT